MDNVAYTKEYQDYRKKFDYIFDNKYLKDIETRKLSDALSLRICTYEDINEQKWRTYCTQAELIDNEQKTVYSVKNIYADAFFDLIEHKNGIQYLMFRIDLYGYSILNLSTMESFHYIPKESFEGGETFIWTGTHYNIKTNILVADGCFWAYPSDLLIMDFSLPTNLPYPGFLFLNHLLNLDSWQEVDFIGWDKDDNLIVEHIDENEKRVTITVDKSFLADKLKQLNM